MTANEIEQYFYEMCKNSSLGGGIIGEVYREGMRPDNPRNEDIVVTLLAGADGQIQEGVTILNIYVADINQSSGRMIPDYRRIGELEKLIQPMIDKSKSGDIYVWTDETPHAVKIEGINQHCIVARLRFKILTD